MLNHYPILLGLALAWLSACGDGSGDDNPASSAGSAGAAGAVASSGAGGAGASGTAGVGGVAAGGGGAGGAAGAGGVVAGQAGVGGAAAGAAGAGGVGTTPAKPTLRGAEWGFDLGEVTLQVDPQTGGRITTFKLGAENLLTGPSVNPTYWGSTLWISPEATLWMQPPPPAIDSDPYTAVATDTTLTLTGMPYAKLGVSATKTFTTDPVLGAFKIEYKLTNTSPAAVSMAPWEVTRVLPRGLTFFPTGPKQVVPAGQTFPTTNQGGITWFSYDMNAITVDSKLYADGAEGWVAHAAQGLVFIKSFGDLAADKIAKDEGDVELYTNKLHTYIEMEDQGPYGAVAPGASVSWSVTWFLRKLPVGVEATAGNEPLAKFVRDTIAGK